jgi:hypothetical protein
MPDAQLLVRAGEAAGHGAAGWGCGHADSRCPPPSLDPQFYQNGGGSDNSELFSIGFIIALAYLGFKAFAALEGL